MKHKIQNIKAKKTLCKITKIDNAKSKQIEIEIDLNLEHNNQNLTEIDEIKSQNKKSPKSTKLKYMESKSGTL